MNTQLPLPFKMTKAQAGARGGKATAERHGRDHMAAIGRKGAAEFWHRYRVMPHGTNLFAIISRETGAVVGYMGAANVPAR